MKKKYVQTRRMRVALQRALVIALAAPAAILGTESCSSDDTSLSPLDAGGSDGGSTDATLDLDGSDAGPVVDGGPCAPKVVYVDAQAPDGGIECGIFQTFACGVPPGQTLFNDCYFLLDNCAHLCPGELYFNCHVYGDKCDAGVIVADADILIECATCPNGVGRRPRGLRRARAPITSSAVGRYFARVAHLEAASVHAFTILHDELAAVGAPAELRRATRAAVRDEIRHARVTSTLARRHGAEPAEPRISRGRPRSLEKILFENAVEGCVRETFGALVAMWQASHTRDPELAKVIQKIAVDETRHAALAWGIASWGDSLLTVRERQRVVRARRKALRELEKEIQIEPHADLVAVVGHPTAAEHRMLLRHLERSLPNMTG